MKNLIRNAATNLAKRFGYTVIPTWRIKDLAMASHLKTVFDDYDIDVVIDVGANSGQYQRFLRDQVEFLGIIHSFEPQPALVEVLHAQSLLDKNWHVHSFGLGSENAELTLNVMALDTFSSFREPDNSSTRKFSKRNSITKKVRVPVKRLDDLIASLQGASSGNVYLKIDTQGFDLEVMKGATNLLARAKGMQFELAIQRIYQDVPHYLDMLRRVNELGFDVSGLFPISSDEHLRIVEVDCVVVKSAK